METTEKEFIIEINGKKIEVNKDVFELTLGISKERDDLKNALNNLVSESESLMDFCIDRKHIDPEDESIVGVITFNAAMNKSKEVLKNSGGRK